MSVEDAKKIINEVYPRPVSNPQYVNPEIKKDLDLSVIIPVYNYVDIIEQNILSILNQKTKYKYEVIIVDDGSTDGAADILRKFENEEKIKLIFQQNGGIGAARNTGINMACGKYLMFIDCDDTVHDDIIETLMSKAYEKDLDMVMAGHNLVKEQGGQVISVIPNIYPQANLSGFKNGDAIMNLAGLPWAKVYKRELWNNVRFFPGYWYEDTIIQMLIFTQVKSFEYIPKVVYEYKWYEKNFSHTQSKSLSPKTIDRYWLFVEIMEQYSKIGLPMDAQLYTLVLKHMSNFFYSEISKQNEDVVKALFVLAGEFVRDTKPKTKYKKIPFMLQQVEKAFESKDIALWKIASCY